MNGLSILLAKEKNLICLSGLQRTTQQITIENKKNRKNF
jgi:hypothetical protein